MVFLSKYHYINYDQVMAWYQIDAKPSPEPMIVKFYPYQKSRWATMT